MKITKLELFSLILMVSLILGGCGAGTMGSVNHISPIKEGVSLEDFTSLVLDSDARDEVEISSHTRKRILSSIIEKIEVNKHNHYKTINTIDELSKDNHFLLNNPNTLIAKIIFTDYDAGNAFARAMLAGLGQIHIDAEITLKRGDTNELLGIEEVTKTFAWGGIYGASTHIIDVEEGFSEAVVAALLKREEDEEENSEEGQ